MFVKGEVVLCRQTGEKLVVKYVDGQDNALCVPEGVTAPYTTFKIQDLERIAESGGNS
jgi:hypothetical protein